MVSTFILDAQGCTRPSARLRRIICKPSQYSNEVKSCKWVPPSAASSSSMDSLFLTDPVFFPKRLLEDLPRSPFGQQIIEINGTRALVTGQPHLAEIQELPLRCLSPFLQDNQGLGQLSPLRIGYGYDGALKDRRV